MHARPLFITRPSTTVAGGGGTVTSIDTVQGDYEAAEVLGGHRIVRSNDDATVSYADKDSIGDTDRVLGVTTGAASIGSTVTVVTYGPLEEPSWAWDMTKQLFLGDTGVIVQTPPATGFMVQIGFPISPTRIFVNIQRPIQLA